MNKELFMVVLPGLSAILFALGGTDINGKGRKWIRRYILPFCFMASCLIGGVSLWQSALVALSGIVAFSLGYGDSKPYWAKLIVALAYGAITLPIGISAINLGTVALFMGLFYLSNIKMTSDIIIWKLWEITMGFLVGIEVAYLLMGKGHIW